MLGQGIGKYPDLQKMGISVSFYTCRIGVWGFGIFGIGGFGGVGTLGLLGIWLFHYLGVRLGIVGIWLFLGSVT